MTEPYDMNAAPGDDPKAIVRDWRYPPRAGGCVLLVSADDIYLRRFVGGIAASALLLAADCGIEGRAVRRRHGASSTVRARRAPRGSARLQASQAQACAKRSEAWHPRVASRAREGAGTVTAG